MKLICAREYPLDFLDMPSLFLAGPTRRDHGVSWRSEALKLLESFPGAVFCPENRSWGIDAEVYEDQIRWEWSALEAATVIAFWIPRELETLPGFTTNVEFGMYWDSGKIVAGSPDDAPKNDYLRMLARRGRVSWYNTLRYLLTAAEQTAKKLYETP